MVAIQSRREISGQSVAGPHVLREALSEVETFKRPSRRDALPEHTHYLDTGCDLHQSCLTCPLVRCRYDEPGGARKLLSANRDQAIVRFQRDHQAPIDVLAKRFSVSRRTVFRVLARARLEADPEAVL